MRCERRYTVADVDEIRRWLGKEAHMPGRAELVTNDADMSAALKESISAVRREKRKK